MRWTPGGNVPMAAQAVGEWQARIDLADNKRKLYEPQWDRALQRYAKAQQPESQYEVNPLLDFRHVESKRAALFYQTPEVQLIPIQPEIADIPATQLMPLRQKVLNYKLSPDAANIKREMHLALFDALCPSGFLVMKMGYESVTAPVAIVNPLTGQPESVDVPVWESCFWTRVSPMKLLIPHDYTSTVFDAAPWLGVKGVMPLIQARRLWSLPEDFSGTTTKDDAVFGANTATAGLDSQITNPMVEYQELWYRAALYDESVLNPELFRCLVMVKGVEQPVKHMDSPYQKIDQTGRLTDDSLIGNPIHVGTLRDYSDSAYIPSDLTVGEQLSTEVAKFRTQQIRRRRANLPLVLLDTTNLDQNTIAKMERNEGPIPLPPGALASGAGAVVQAVSPGTEPRDNYTAQDYAERDWERALGSGANQVGAFNRGRRTATEARIVATNADARAEVEKDRLREYFMAGVRKFDAILQQFMTPQELAKILGLEAAQLWDQWRALPGKYLYRVQPDSGVFVDAQQYRAQKLDEYNLLRRDPALNPQELLNNVLRALGHDPAKMIQPPPERAPEPARVTLTLNGEDLSSPHAAMAIEVLQQAGYKITPPPGLMPPSGDDLSRLLGGMATGPVQPHGGGALQAERVNQHAAQTTGGVQGVTP